MDETTNICAICHDGDCVPNTLSGHLSRHAFTDDKEIRRLFSCGHSVHAQCGRNPSRMCPVCRKRCESHLIIATARHEVGPPARTWVTWCSDPGCVNSTSTTEQMRYRVANANDSPLLLKPHHTAVVACDACIERRYECPAREVVGWKRLFDLVPKCGQDPVAISD